MLKKVAFKTADGKPVFFQDFLKSLICMQTSVVSGTSEDDLVATPVVSIDLYAVVRTALVLFIGFLVGRKTDMYKQYRQRKAASI